MRRKGAGVSSALDPATAQRLRACVEALQSHGGVPRHVVRPYVWAVFNGEDPQAAVLKAHFGRAFPDDLGPVAYEYADRWIAAIKSAPVQVPVREGAA